MKMLCIGQMGWDITRIGTNKYQNYGGSVLHFTVAAAVMGAEVDILSYVNKKEWKDILFRLDKVGVGTEKIIDFYDTIDFHMYYDQDMNFCKNKFRMNIDKNEPLIFNEISENETYDLYNICETTPEQDEMTVHKILGYNPQAKLSMQFHIDNLLKNKKMYLDMLKKIDYIFMNLEEALYLSDENMIEEAIDFFQKRIKNTLFITSHQTNYAIRHNTIISLNTLPINIVVDPTGAGDCFAGTIRFQWARRWALDVRV